MADKKPTIAASDSVEPSAASTASTTSATTATTAPPAAVASAASTTSSASNITGKRPRDWFGAAGDGGAQKAAAVASKLAASDTAHKLSSLKAKLSKPKVGGSASSEGPRKTALSREQLMESQQRHREKLEANGKAVPHYRKNPDKL